MNTGYRLEKPFHPGGFVRRKIFEPRNLTIMGAAATLGVTRQGLSDFLAERASLTVEIAFEIEKAFGFNAEALMEMQTRFDLALLRQRHRAAQLQVVARQGSRPSKSGRRSAA